MIFYSKVPLRISFAGGGTDVSPYCNLYGGAVLNAAITLYAHSSIELLNEPVLVLEEPQHLPQTHPLAFPLPIDGTFSFAKGVINRMQKDFGLPKYGFRLSSFADVPMGSGLGTSSTLVVSILSVFNKYLSLGLTNFDIAHYAYDIERNDLGFAGGRQDQYASTFGGINFIEFLTDNTVNITPLQLSEHQLYHLSNHIVLYYTSVSRLSSVIITEQQKNVRENNAFSLHAMHHIKQQAMQMKDALLSGDTDNIGALLEEGFREKKRMAANISNPFIEHIYQTAKKAGASGGKISGAGGGGFMFFYCPNNTKSEVETALALLGGKIYPFSFSAEGHSAWSVYEQLSEN